MKKKTAKTFPTCKYEVPLWKDEQWVLGVDEVGRGCLAGPVYIAVVCLKPTISPTIIKQYESMGINDSKKLSHKQRTKLVTGIKDICAAYSVCSESVEVINTVGIVEAIHRAVRKGVENICKTLGEDKSFHCLIDAFAIDDLPYIPLRKQTAIIHGDSLSVSIAAASILAKVARDEFMSELGEQFPQYSWSQNKGYGTRDHLDAILEHGRCEHHRDLFIRNILGSQGLE